MQGRRPLPQKEFSALADALEHVTRAASGENRVRFARARRALRCVEAYLRRPLRVAVLGEQNSGKSSLINMLLRADVVPAGVLAALRTHLLLRHGPETAVVAVAADGARARLTSRALARMAVPEIRAATGGSPVIYSAAEPKAAPAREGKHAVATIRDAPQPAADSARLIELIRPHPLLQRAELLESRLYPPGSENSVLRRAFRPIDMAVWCTLATQAWKETEREAWQRFPASLGRDALLVVTYKDALANAKEEARLMGRLRRDAGPFFAGMLTVSARRAMEALGAPGEGSIADPARWERSGAAAFEAALEEALARLHRRRLAKADGLLRRLAARLPESPAQSRSGTVARQFERLAATLQEEAGGA
jgi:hypothetical protein